MAWPRLGREADAPVRRGCRHTARRWTGCGRWGWSIPASAPARRSRPRSPAWRARRTDPTGRSIRAPVGGWRRLPGPNGIAAGIPYALRLDAVAAATLTGPLTWRESGEGADRGAIPVDPALNGDVVLARKDVPTSYHLGVVVDDAFQAVDLVTRGLDLIHATHVHRLLQALLGLPEPAYAHHRLLTDETGQRLAKRADAFAIRHYRDHGLAPDEVWARAGVPWDSAAGRPAF